MEKCISKRRIQRPFRLAERKSENKGAKIKWEKKTVNISLRGTADLEKDVGGSM